MKTNRKLITCLVAVMCLGLTSAVRADDQNSSQTDQNASKYGRHHEGQSSQWQNNAENSQAGQPTKFNKASKLIGMNVQNPQGQDLGEIKDIVINLDSGSVSYAVLSSGGVLGVGEKLLAVPLSAFKRSADRQHLVLQATQANISQAQGIGNNWPSVENPSFGAMPFWKQGENNQTPQSPSNNR